MAPAPPFMSYVCLGRQEDEVPMEPVHSEEGKTRMPVPFLPLTEDDTEQRERTFLHCCSYTPNPAPSSSSSKLGVDLFTRNITHRLPKASFTSTLRGEWYQAVGTILPWGQS